MVEYYGAWLDKVPAAIAPMVLSTLELDLSYERFICGYSVEQFLRLLKSTNPATY